MFEAPATIAAPICRAAGATALRRRGGSAVAVAQSPAVAVAIGLGQTARLQPELRAWTAGLLLSYLIVYYSPIAIGLALSWALRVAAVGSFGRDGAGSVSAQRARWRADREARVFPDQRRAVERDKR